jgi:hypothetical protein
VTGSADVIDSFLPAEFSVRLPTADRAWRGRIVLFLWALGYPLEMAWSLALTDEPEQVAFYHESLGKLPDEELTALLDATASQRGDGGNLMFATLGEPDS